MYLYTYIHIYIFVFSCNFTPFVHKYICTSCIMYVMYITYICISCISHINLLCYSQHRWVDHWAWAWAKMATDICVYTSICACTYIYTQLYQLYTALAYSLRMTPVTVLPWNSSNKFFWRDPCEGATLKLDLVHCA